MAGPASEAAAAWSVVEADENCWVYLLRCGDGSLYCGWTNDMARRLTQHQAGVGARYTRSRQPVALAWAQPAADRSSALREEARIKRLPRAAKLALVARASRTSVPTA